MRLDPFTPCPSANRRLVGWETPIGPQTSPDCRTIASQRVAIAIARRQPGARVVNRIDRRIRTQMGAEGLALGQVLTRPGGRMHHIDGIEIRGQIIDMLQPEIMPEPMGKT